MLAISGAIILGVIGFAGGAIASTAAHQPTHNVTANMWHQFHGRISSRSRAGRWFGMYTASNHSVRIFTSGGTHWDGCDWGTMRHGYRVNVRAYGNHGRWMAARIRNGGDHWGMMGVWQGQRVGNGSSASGSAQNGPNYQRGMMAGASGSYGMMGGWQQQSAARRSQLTIDQAQHRLELYIRQYNDSHLVIDEIMQFQRNFYAVVNDTSTGHSAFEVLVNKWTGRVFPEYGPAMVWNTKYGMMCGGMMNRCRSGRMTVSAAHATRIARSWLAHHRPGATMDMIHQFPGYYTEHFKRHGTIAGMFSINGYSGRVWYHTWHGKFIRMKTVSG
jgi:hypothetical protein